jgi:ubiquinone/menaquinone biosynthesis C-methylase UbiE
MYKSKILDAFSAFRKAVIYEAYKVLGLATILKHPSSAEEVAAKLKLNADAVRRFFYALAYLELIQENDGLFIATATAKLTFTSSSTLTLIKFVKANLAEILVGGPLSGDEIQNAYVNGTELLKLLDDATLHQFVKQDNMKYTLPDEVRPLLLKGSPHYCGPILKYIEEIGMPTFCCEALINGLKTGHSQWQLVVGASPKNPFLLYKSNPKLMKTFMLGLHKLNEQDNQAIVKQLPWESDHFKILDMGGGSGGLATELIKINPNIAQVDILEMVEAIPLLKEIFASLCPPNHKINFIHGSFFESFAKPACPLHKLTSYYDWCILSWILHDWDDIACTTILRNAYYVLKPGGRIIIFEAILPENRISKATLSDLTMLLHTEGRERTFSEYKLLLSQAGFKSIQQISSDTRRQIIYGVKV